MEQQLTCRTIDGRKAQQAFQLYRVCGNNKPGDGTAWVIWCPDFSGFSQKKYKTILIRVKSKPDPFSLMFELNKDEFNNLKSQIVTSSWGGAIYFPKKKIGFTVKERQKAYGKSKKAATSVEFSLTLQAQKIWNAIPGEIRMKILNNVWCVNCSDITSIGSVNGKIEKGMLVLRGICTRCGGSVARVLEDT
ncbi:hypothetical protein MUO98_05330 [Candidatus Bathyarchaeota archaeon]|nr:hypothetical protein [Candidatus Bathyarchaeota archaeon]